MKDCGCHVTSKTLTERKILRIALALNATMFVIGLIAGLFTRADLVVNIGVILSGAMVAITKSRYPDLIVGCLVGLFVIKESYEILMEARIK